MWKKKAGFAATKVCANGARKLDQTDSGLVKIHYFNLRILFPVREGILTRSRPVKAPVAFLSFSPRYLNGGYCS